MLRESIPEDAEAIERIKIAAWRAAYTKFIPGKYLSELDYSQNIEVLRERLSVQNIEFSVSVAEEAGAVSAFSIIGKPRYEAPPGTIELWALNVHPDHWRKGNGQRLTERAIQSSIQAGFNNIDLWCIRGNLPAQSAYEKVGFLPTGGERSSSHLTGSPLHELHYTQVL